MDNGTEMDIKEAAEALDLSPSRCSELLEKKVLLQEWGEYEDFFRFSSSVGKIDEGSVLVKKGNGFEFVQGFPKIKRAIMLAPAIKSHFASIDTVVVEEKMNGYNVRVIEHKGELIAFTRSGHVCPYSSERANHLLEHDIFKDHPEYVVYGEMVGPDNPYVPKHIYEVDSLEFFAFDIRSKEGIPLPVHERRSLAADYGLTQVELLGEFAVSEAAKGIRDIIPELGKKEREGVIIKDPAMVLQPLKYTTSETNCADLRHGFRYYNESGKDYLFARVVREGFQSVEWNDSKKDLERRCLMLGESILMPMRESIMHVQEGERLWEDVQIRVREVSTIGKFRMYLERLGLDVIFGSPEPIGDEYVVKIRKMNKSTTDKTLGIIEGQLWS
ncbi:RNA ligase [Methanolobus sp.]|uniref:RNA ligase n=1 Tax=Methanolobus sp. TaxID=1874737 RepID=UPI0025CF7656|nr:RNA ligase [Methanolobus sp.]